MESDLDLTAVAERVAADAADLVRDAYESMLTGATVAVDTKTSATDVVTAVDTASERLVRERLAELRPYDAVLGEEEGTHGATLDLGEEGVTWVVDPIDGTVNFLYGLPWFAVSVAAQIGGVSVAGAVVEPVSGRRWTATRGKGAWLDGRPLRVSAPTDLGVSLLATGFAYRSERRARQADFAARILGRVRDLRRQGSAALDLCAVAAGWVDAYVEHGLKRWDWAAGALVAEEAGAVLALPGQDPGLGADTILAAAPSIADPLRAALLECGVGAV
ncbi:inositol monophosphatase family protein [Saccharomonospora xinjiangensis]|uniref:Inositol-1-monophosphatase n=1 Tax=Saccharomonospora xinjiangensis XJ-54 TaxID=882086 RepID=I0V742_9PSEU|nr:inositol monophosphatase family protein [Saccharomonospora xinjiangensis]EID55945.1 inositol monophosphatase/fructose-1,6-bisphosphatase family protein [Saccharomonospora xinjiangensis XJ-54]